MKKVVYLILLVGALLFFSPAKVQAQEVYGTIDNMAVGLSKLIDSELIPDEYCQIIGNTQQPSLEYTTVGDVGCKIENGQRITLKEGGALPFVNKQVASVMSTKPVSSTEYFANVWDNIGFPGSNNQAYAQTGVGFNALTPVLPIWKAFRNIAYFLYVILFVVIGFMIMFRAKLNPQTVVNIQTAMPNLILTLILITFSYAIAGLLIDLIYVFIAVAANVFTQAGMFNSAGVVIDRLLTQDLFGIMFGRFTPLDGQSNPFVMQPANAVQSIVENLTGGIVEDVAGWSSAQLAKLIFGVMLLVALIRLLVTLGIGFFRIILGVVTAPLQILMNALPGSQAFSMWFRSILANVAMFPAVAILFMIAAALVGPHQKVYTATTAANPWGVQEGIGYNALETDTQWSPPFLMLRTDAGDSSISPMVALIGFFAIMMAPKVAEMTRDYLKLEAPSYTSAIGEAFGPAGNIVSSPFRRFREQREQATQATRQAEAFGEAVSRLKQ